SDVAIESGGPQQRFPQHETWVIDPGHSILQFEVRHLMVSKVRGCFREFSGEIQFGPRPEDSSVAVVARAASLDSRLEKRDEHLRSEDFFDVDRHPTLSF